MLKEEELDLLFKRLIGTRLEVRIYSIYTTCIIKFELSRFSFSCGSHRSNVSDAMIKDHGASLYDENYNVGFHFEFKDVESLVKDDTCELQLIYRDGTKVMIAKEGNLI
jgi:hypothetical protein